MITSAGIVTWCEGAELLVSEGSGYVRPGPNVTVFSPMLVRGNVVSSIAGSFRPGNPFVGAVSNLPMPTGM